MASRSLTDVFLLMRNNAVRSRHIYPDQVKYRRKIKFVALKDVILSGQFGEDAPGLAERPGGGFGRQKWQSNAANVDWLLRESSNDFAKAESEN